MSASTIKVNYYLFMHGVGSSSGKNVGLQMPLEAFTKCQNDGLCFAWKQVNK